MPGYFIFKTVLTHYVSIRAERRKKNQSIPTMYGGVSCRYVAIFGSNEVPDPVRALYTPITHDRVLQIQNGFNTLCIYWGTTLKKKISQFGLCMEV